MDQYESPCGSGLNIGQSFTAEATGLLNTVYLARCTASDARLVLRAYNGSGADWDTGTILGEADQVLVGTGDPDGCYTSGGNGFTHYAVDTFTFSNLAVESGVQYLLHLVEGVAATGCSITYSGGIAFASAGAKTGEDLAFGLSICPEAFAFGCTDAAACNYDASATAEDGSCLVLDCAGQCGGSAYEDPDCGCVPSINDAGSCFGCTDAGACNYDGSYTVDDGTCFYPICNGACPDILDHYETPCGTGLNYGQGFTAGITGMLNSITIARCTGVDTRILIRNYNGDGANWDEGTIIGEADQVAAGSANPSDCFISGGNGFTHYVETTFTFTNIGLEAGQQYVFHLEQGVAATGCTLTYSGGTAFGLNAAKPDEDLVFELSICPDNVTFGCTDSEACNYDSTADVEDGSCLFLDCQGTCGGSAYLDPDCGCLDSVNDAGQCLGCIDVAACNYDATATVSDGSCSLPDCHGDCGGTALNSTCGCIGGNTGIPADACVDGCITNIDATDPEACPPGILYGQSIIPAENGLLKRVRLQTCCALDAQLVLRSLTNTDPCSTGGGGEWNSGTILSYSNTVPSSCSGVTSCLTGFGLDGYHWHNFNFDDVPVQAGTTYILELISGVAIANCSSDYEGGQAYNATEAIAEYDLAFSLHICPAAMNWGCTDSNACTFDNSATQDDGSCAYLDCNGDCGGTAEDLTGCGCIGGNTGIRTAQCVNGDLHEITLNDGTICNETIHGQTWTADNDGFLSRVGLHVMPNEAQTIRMSRANGPNSGEVLLEYTRSASSSSCTNIGPEWIELNFYNIPLQAGSEYKLEFLAGSGYRTCYAQYPNGSGVNSAGSTITHDLAFRVVYRLPEPGELVWGCSDSNHCNYDPAVTNDDGSCTTLDCNGDCGGTAYEIQGCGCVEGITGIAAESCYGCMDASACNYDNSASIDDGSCATFDCNGDCGGTAIDNAKCGCVGGNTGIDQGTCLELCQGSLSISTYDGTFSSDNYAQGGSGQTFIAEETAYLTATRFRQNNLPASTITLQLRALDGSNVRNGTLLATQTHGTWTDTEGAGGDLFFEWVEPVLLTQGQGYALVFNGTHTLILVGETDAYAGGASFDGLANDAADDDLFFEFYTCDELLGCIDPTACNFDDTATADADVTLCVFPTGCETCTGETDGTGTTVDNDADDDGVCNADEILGCTHSAACNYDATPTTDTDNSLCVYPEDCQTCSGETDGTGTVVDNDADNDGVCDADEVTGCTDANACNYDTTPTTDTDNSLCAYATGCDTCSGESNGSGTVVDNDADNDGVCDANEIDGCTDVAACNYDATSTTDTDNNLCVYPEDCETCSGETNGTGTVVDNDADNDGVCDANEIDGCTDSAACNYDATPTTDTDNSLCVFTADPCDTCSGENDGSGTVVDNDADNDGVCDANEVTGCTDTSACNYDATPTTDTDNSLCVFTADPCDTCSGETDGSGTVVDNDADNDGVCDANEVDGCTNITACNYDATPTTDTDNSLCEFPVGCETCTGETDGSGSVSQIDNDIDDDGVCNDNEIKGCTDVTACNYDATPTTDTDNSLCVFTADPCDTCSGENDGTGTVVDNDADNDGVCDANEVEGCTDITACNYDATSTTDTDNSLCIFTADPCDTCSGENDGTGTVVNNDADNDGVCDANEVDGCTDLTACNYDATPTTDTDNSLCIYPVGCDTCSGENDGSGTVVDNDADNDGVCDANEVDGCTDLSACNYDATPTTDTDNSLCVFTADPCDTCSGETDGSGTVVDNDADNDGVCDANEVDGCTNISACNYDATPTTDTDNSLCVFTADPCDTCSGENDGSGTVVDNDADNDGVCDANEVEGCTDITACNYDATSTTDTDNSLCVFTADPCDTCSGENDGTGTVVNNDADNDGVCDANEVDGCTDITACNYDATPTTDTDNSLCVFTADPCDTCSGETDGTGTVVDNDADNDGVCDANEVEGCTDVLACNYDATPTTDTDNSLCVFTADPCDTCSGENDGSGTVVDNDADNDGVCDANEVEGCTDITACNYDATPTTDTDNSLCVFTADPCDTCSGETDGSGTVVDNDADNDGVCDANEVEGCTDTSACNYDATPTTDTDNSLCVFTADPCDTCSGENDGSGTVVDNDADNDGVCDANEVDGCTDLTACNYDATSTTNTDNSLCEFPVGCETCTGETDGTGTVVDNDADNDGVCDANEVDGCTDLSACNYDATPTTDTDNSLCVFTADPCDTCSGETDGSGTVVDNDADNDGVCDANEVDGCTDLTACNYDATSTTDTDNSLCVYPVGCDTCSGETDGSGTVVDNDADNDGVCDANEVEGCTDITACNYDATPTTDTDNSLCVFTADPCDTCSGETDGTGTVVDNDADNDGVCDANEVDGCTNITACNYDATPTTDTDNSLCVFPVGCDTCSGENDGSGTVVDNDADSDGVCDANEVEGCTDVSACNYDATPTTDTDNSLCVFTADPCDTCSGENDGSGTVVDNDADNDGVCDANEVDGCTDTSACNYDATPTTDTDNSLCVFTADPCDTCSGETDGSGTVVDNDADNDGVCDANEVTGCTDASACNYDAAPTTDNEIGLCVFPSGCETCSGETNGSGTTVDNDDDSDGVCNDDEVLGCADEAACNYDDDPTTNIDNSLCVFATGCDICSGETDGTGVVIDLGTCGCMVPEACNYDVTANVDQGTCEYDSCSGCRNQDACNYDASATVDGPLGTCIYPGLYQDCSGNCINDSNVNGLCDELEAIGVEGCTDAAATNFNPFATLDNGSCFTYTLAGCLIPSASNFDPSVNVQGQPLTDYCTFPFLTPPALPSGSVDCADSYACNYDPAASGYSECDYCLGCTDAGACNYNPSALYEDGSCTYSGCSGCTSSCSSNYDAAAVIDNGTCDYANCGGCTDADADNYNAGATIDDGSCQYVGCTFPSACNYDPSANADDGSCGYNAPVFTGITGTATSGFNAIDGTSEITVTSGSPTSLILTGLNGAQDFTFSLPGTASGIPPGYYQAQVMDDDGCLGVAAAPGGITASQPTVSRPLIIGYAQCCQGCGIHDSDTDGICDDSDNCIDKTAPNFNDPANGACE